MTASILQDTSGESSSFCANTIKLENSGAYYCNSYASPIPSAPPPCIVSVGSINERSPNSSSMVVSSANSELVQKCYWWKIIWWKFSFQILTFPLYWDLSRYPIQVMIRCRYKGTHYIRRQDLSLSVKHVLMKVRHSRFSYFRMASCAQAIE